MLIWDTILLVHCKISSLTSSAEYSKVQSWTSWREKDSTADMVSRGRVQTAANHRLTGNRVRWIHWNRMTYIDWVQTKTTTRQINTVHHSLHEGREVHVDEGMEVGLPYFLRKPRWTPAVLMPAVVIAATGTEVRGRERVMLENGVRESDRERERESEREGE